MREVTTPDVPATDIGQVSEDARDANAIKIVATRNADGTTWTVVVTFALVLFGPVATEVMTTLPLLSVVLDEPSVESLVR